MGLEVACLYDGKPYRSLFPFTLQALYQLDVYVITNDVFCALISRLSLQRWSRSCSRVGRTLFQPA